MFTGLFRKFTQPNKLTKKVFGSLPQKTTNSIFDASGKNVVKLSGVPSEWDERHLQKYFDPYIKKLDRVVLGKDSMGNAKFNAFLVFSNPEDADRFVKKYHNDFINSSKDIEKIKAEIYQPRTNETKLKVLDSDRQVELYNLPFEATNLDVLGIAEQFAKVKEIQMPTRNSTLNKGYALLTFNDGRAAKKFCDGIEAMTLFGREIKARQKFISFATQKPRIGSKSDMIFEKAETPEIRIKGSLLAAAMKLEYIFSTGQTKNEVEENV
jgi:RNA recognition motif-containing protein